jgi:hypothetical protein
MALREPCRLCAGRDSRENCEIASGTTFRNRVRSAVLLEISFGSAPPDEISAERHPYTTLVTETLPRTPPRTHFRSRSGVKSGANWSPRACLRDEISSGGRKPMFLYDFLKRKPCRLSSGRDSRENGEIASGTPPPESRSECRLA